MPRISFIFIIFTFLFSMPARGMTDAELEAVREGFAVRRDAALATLAGRPFRPAKKQPPLGPGRAPYVRAYAWSVTDFAMKTFLLGEPPAPANAALIELFHCYSGDRPLRNDQDSFYWSMDVVSRMVEYYGRAGTRAAGRLSPEAEDAALEMMFVWVKENSRLGDAEYKQSETWAVWGSENHHLMRFSTCWDFSRILMARPAWRDRPYDDGKTARVHYDAWTAYAKAYLAERARKSLNVEIANDGYNTESLKGVCNIYEFAPDPELRRRAGLLLDLYWACWAQEQLGGVRGGGKTRIYPGGSSTRGLARGIASLAWYTFGLGAPSTPAGEEFTFLTCPWRPPLVVLDLALDAAGRGEYEIRSWPLGLAVKDFDNFPQYKLRTDFGGILRYSWCTPELIMGTLMFEARPPADWAAISSQNRWQGVVFAGDPDARIYPQVVALKRNRAYNQHWSAQRRGTLITQKLKTSKGAGEMRVWISERGVKTVAEAGGWVFAEAAGAFAAVRPARGGYGWESSAGFQPAKRNDGRWLVPKDEWTPVLIEVARKSEMKNSEEFQKKVLARPLKFEKNVLDYTSISGDRFTFFADYSRLPLINDEAPDLKPRASFESPFIRSARDSGVVTIQKGERKLVLDFNGPAAQ